MLERPAAQIAARSIRNAFEFPHRIHVRDASFWPRARARAARIQNVQKNQNGHSGHAHVLSNRQTLCDSTRRMELQLHAAAATVLAR